MKHKCTQTSNMWNKVVQIQNQKQVETSSVKFKPKLQNQNNTSFHGKIWKCKYATAYQKTKHVCNSIWPKQVQNNEFANQNTQFLNLQIIQPL